MSIHQQRGRDFTAKRGMTCRVSEARSICIADVPAVCASPESGAGRSAYLDLQLHRYWTTTQRSPGYPRPQIWAQRADDEAHPISQAAAPQDDRAGDGAVVSDPHQEVARRAGVATLRGVEIAPLSRATVKKSEGDITYVDLLSYEQLLVEHRGAAYIGQSDILHIDVVLGDRSIAEAFAGKAPFDYAIASHAIEHIPDLISWFADVRTILRPNGTFRLAIPDRRFTFDYLREATKASEVLNAYAQRAKIPTSQCIMDHYLNVRTLM